MPRLQAPIAVALSALCLAPLAGCQDASSAPPLSIQAEAPAQPSGHQRLVGTWSGTFELDRQAIQAGRIDEESRRTLESARLELTFRGDGELTMAATMQTPEGPFTSEVKGTWEIVSQQGDSLTIRSTEEGSSPEEVAVRMADANTMLMSPPDDHRDIGVIRFQRR